MKKFKMFFEEAMNELNASTKKFDFGKYELYGIENALDCIKEGKRRKAYQAKEDGEIESSEGSEKYVAGDWIVTDDKGSQYIIHDADFNKLYDVDDCNEDGYKPKPDKRRMCRMAEPQDIDTDWGLLHGDAGYWYQVKNGKLGAPISVPDMNSAYTVEDTPENNEKIEKQN